MAEDTHTDYWLQSDLSTLFKWKCKLKGKGFKCANFS